MEERELFSHRFDAADPDRVWAALKRVLDTMDTKRTDDKAKRAVFATSLSTSSWGQNHVAEVGPGPNGGATLVVRGRPKSSLLTTAWGEKRHAKGLEKRIVGDVDATLTTMI